MRKLNSVHPLVAAIYFLSVFLIIALLQNTFNLLIAFICALTFCVCLKNINFFKDTAFYILIILIAAITNPLFSHKGETILLFLNNNPITLEAIITGLNIGLMIVGFLCWFKCFNIIITQDKLLYLFSRFSPKIALLISSSLRFFPLLSAQAKKIKNVQKTMGIYNKDSYFDKLKSTLRVYSSLISFALENAMDTGISMNARGYNLKNKTSYSIFKFKIYDIVLLLFILILDALLILNLNNLITFLSIIILFLLPSLLEIKEGLKWKYLIYKM